MANDKSLIVGRGVKTIADGAVERIYVTGERKQFVVTNLTAGSNLYVTGPDEVPALVAIPNLPITLETDSEFKIKNISGFTITYVVGELFLVDFRQGGGGSRGQASGSGAGSAGSGGNSTGRGTGNVFLP